MGLFGPNKVTAVSCSGRGGNCAQCGRVLSDGRKKIIFGGPFTDGSSPSGCAGDEFCSVGCAKSFAEGKGWIFK